MSKFRVMLGMLRGGRLFAVAARMVTPIALAAASSGEGDSPREQRPGKEDVSRFCETCRKETVHVWVATAPSPGTAPIEAWDRLRCTVCGTEVDVPPSDEQIRRRLGLPPGGAGSALLTAVLVAALALASSAGAATDPGPRGFAAGAYHACVITAAGGLDCYGDNSAGELGDGTKTNSVAAVAVVGLPTPVLEVAAHYDRTCALVTGPRVYCWGRAAKLSSGKFVASSTPVKVGGLPAGAHALAVGQTHACVLDTAGVPWCWGTNDRGQIGDGTTKLRGTAVKTKAPAVATLVASDDYSCALLKAGGVECWGKSHGSDGDPLNPEGLVVDSRTPVRIAGLDDAVDLAASGDFACAILAGGPVDCWGENDHYQLADGTTTGRSTPAAVPGLAPSVQLVATANHACSLAADGSVACWGRGDHGQMGNGTWADSCMPVAVSQPQPATRLYGSASGHWTVAVGADGSLLAWGRDQYGQLGDGGTVDQPIPVPVTAF